MSILGISTDLLSRDIQVKRDRNRAWQMSGATTRRLQGAMYGPGTKVAIQNFPRLDYLKTIQIGGTITPESGQVTESELEITQKFHARYEVAVGEELQSNVNLMLNSSAQLGYNSQQDVERAVARKVFDGRAINLDKDNPSAISSGTIYDKFSEINQALHENDAMQNGEDVCVFADPRGVSTLSRAGELDGFDSMQYRGALNRAATGGFVSAFASDMYRTNNIPMSQKLTIDVNPSNGDTISISVPNLADSNSTISTVVLTFVNTLSGVPGQVLIGATLPDTQNNLIAQIREGAGSGVTYETLATDDRNRLKKCMVNLEDFDTNDVAYWQAVPARGTTITSSLTGSVGDGTKAVVYSMMVRGAIDHAEKVNSVWVDTPRDSNVYALNMEFSHGQLVDEENQFRIANYFVQA